MVEYRGSGLEVKTKETKEHMRKEDRFVRFIDVYIPVTTCNLRCHYCYVTQHRLFDTSSPSFRHTPDEFYNAINTKRFGGPCLLNFCGGGETLLSPESVDYIKAALAAGHYVMVVTNGTVTKAFDRIARFPTEYLERLFFKFSYHYLELKHRNLSGLFFRNIRAMRDAGASFTLEAVPSDELMPYIDAMKRQSLEELGAWCHVTVPRSENSRGIPLRTEMDRSSFYNTWKVFDSPFFEYKFSLFGVKLKNFCYAGKWSYFLDMDTGDLSQCYNACCLQNIYENPNSSIREKPIGHFCRLPHCFNAHAFLALGDMPDRNDPTYDVLRNRVCLDGSEWIKPRMKRVLSCRLGDVNHKWSKMSECLSDIGMLFFGGYRVMRKIMREALGRQKK